MEKMYEKTKRYEEMALLLFKLLFMVIGYMQASSLTFGRPIISWVQWPTVFLGGLILLYRVAFFNKYMKSKGLFLLILFAAGYAVSSLLTLRYGVSNNMRYFVFLVFQFGLLYATDANADPVRHKKQLGICMNFHIVVSALLSIASFVFMIIGYSKTFIPAPGSEGPSYHIGFVYGRLFGAYWDPNIAATMCAISILLSLYFLFQKKAVLYRVLYVLNIILQVTYITFSDSRTGKLSLLVGVSAFALLMALKHTFSKKWFIQALCVVLTVGLSMGVTYKLPQLIKDAYNHIIVTYQEEQPSSPSGNQSSSSGEIKRGEELTTDPSNRRFDIWRSAVDIFKTSPVFGVSRANILPYVDDNLPDSYLINNDHMRFDSMHNMVFEILASQGLVGLLSFVAFAAWCAGSIVKNRKYLWNNPEYTLFILIVSIIAMVCTCTLVMVEIVYVISPISTLFWLSLGCLNSYMVHDCKQKALAPSHEA